MRSSLKFSFFRLHDRLGSFSSMVLGGTGGGGEGRNIETPDTESWAYFTFALDSDCQDTRPLSLTLPNQSTSPLLCPNQDPQHLPFCSTDSGLGTPLGSSCSKQLLHRLSFMKTKQKLKCKEKADSSFRACFLIFIFLKLVDREMD